MKKKSALISNIQTEMKKYHLSKREFCELIGETTEDFNHWTARKVMPMSVVIKASYLFRCSLDYLAREKETNN